MARQRRQAGFEIEFEYYDPDEGELRDLLYRFSPGSGYTREEAFLLARSWAIEAIEDYKLERIGVFDAENLLRGHTIRRL